MSHHSELRDLRPEGTHFKNKYKFVILKITMTPQIKEAFHWSNVNKKSTSQHPFQFRSALSFIHTIFSRNRHLLLVLTLLTSDLTLCSAAVIIGICSTLYFEDIFRIMSENSCSHKNVQLIIKLIWRTNWVTSGHETTVC